MIHRKIHAEDVNEDYYVPVDILNVADELHVTDSSNTSHMKGYDGSTLAFKMEDGTVEHVTGPWHTNSRGFINHTGINISELHLTKITLWQDDEIIYEEKAPVLGPYYRGDRIARQLAIIRNKEIKVKSESSGGSSTKTCYPDGRFTHPLSKRKNDV